MKKKSFPTELAYLLGILILAVGTALMERADFGMSMVVAPAYLLHLKLSQVLPFFTFGMAEYTLQGVLLLLLVFLLRKFRLAFLFSFVTAVLYGLTLDGVMLFTALLPADAFALRLFYYLAGMLICAAAIALLFRTYIPPEAYELFVKEVSALLHMDIHRVKTVYDCVSCVISILLSFAFFGLFHFEGIKLGTVFCALVNGSLIGIYSQVLDAAFVFEDALPFRSRFEQ